MQVHDLKLPNVRANPAIDDPFLSLVILSIKIHRVSKSTTFFATIFQ
jgi:hypothetical protein